VVLFKHAVWINTIKENGYFRAARKSRLLSLFHDEALTLQHLMLFVKPRMTFVDVGANIGIFSILMSDVSRLYPDFNVVALEVHPSTYERLSRNAARYGFTAHNIAAGSHSGRETFVEGAVSHVTTVLEKMNTYNVPSRRFEMEMRRVDSFEFERPLFIKIDVEGQELEVLRGVGRLFAEGRVDAVYIDHCDEIDIVDTLLRDHDFTILDARTLSPATRPQSLLALRRGAYPEAVGATTRMAA
jgi:FkbM family methyltransferase